MGSLFKPLLRVSSLFIPTIKVFCILKLSVLILCFQRSFGIVLDIDGVLLRGRDLLPRTRDAIAQITHNGI